jgi:hypothetical protein
MEVRPSIWYSFRSFFSRRLQLLFKLPSVLAREFLTSLAREFLTSMCPRPHMNSRGRLGLFHKCDIKIVERSKSVRRALTGGS